MNVVYEIASHFMFSMHWLQRSQWVRHLYVHLGQAKAPAARYHANVLSFPSTKELSVWTDTYPGRYLTEHKGCNPKSGDLLLLWELHLFPVKWHIRYKRATLSHEVLFFRHCVIFITPHTLHPGFSVSPLLISLFLEWSLLLATVLFMSDQLSGIPSPLTVVTRDSLTFPTCIRHLKTHLFTGCL